MEDFILVQTHPVRYAASLKVQILHTQIPFRYEPPAGNPPLIRTGYYYLPSSFRRRRLPVMLLFHGLAGYGGICCGKNPGDVGIMGAGAVMTFQVQFRNEYALQWFTSPGTLSL